MATLNTGTSVVDYIKSTGGDYSFGARAKLAVEQGIVKSANQYSGSFEQNTSLLQKLQGTKKATPAQVVSKQDANSFINARQDDDIAKVKQSEEPPARSTSQSIVDAFRQLSGRDSLVPDYTVEAPNFEQSYAQFRQKNGLDELESSINELDAQEQEIEARMRERFAIEEGKPVALNVISGRIGEVERQEMERLDFIGRQKQRAVNELQTANNVIETTMNLRKMDYDVAKETYNTQFSQNIQLFNTVKGLAELDISEEEREQDNARSNLQIMYNTIKDGGLDVATVDATTAARISSLELKAGLPQGFYKSIANSVPDSKVLSTTTRTANGTKYADVILQGKDGSLTTKSITLGAASTGSGSLSASEQKNLAYSTINELLTLKDPNGVPYVDQDGYFTEQGFKTIQAAASSDGIRRGDFIEEYQGRLDPYNPEKYGLSVKEVEDLFGDSVERSTREALNPRPAFNLNKTVQHFTQ